MVLADRPGVRDARRFALVNQATVTVSNGPGAAVFDYIYIFTLIEAALARKRVW